MNKTILYSVFGLGVLMYALWFLQSANVGMETPEIEEVANAPADELLVEETFVSPQTGETIRVAFGEETALLTNSEYDALVLTQIPAAGGARYGNSETGIALWNKGAEVSLYKDDVVTFQGQTEATLGQPNPGEVNVRTSALTAHSWLWQKTEMSDGEVIVPKRPDAFVVTFSADGRLSATTDCNGFGGSYTVTDGVIETGPFMMTKMFCEGSQEMEFQDMLDEPMTFMFTDAGELVLMLPYDSGSVIFTPKF